MSDFEKVYKVEFDTRQAEAAVKRLDKSFDIVERKAKEIGKKFDVLVGDKATKAMYRLNRSTKRLGDGLDRVGRATKGVQREFKQNIAKASVASMNRLNKKVKATQLSLSKVRTTVNGISRNLAIASAAFVGLGGASIRAAIKMNEGMAKIATLIPGQTERVKQLKTEIQELAKETGVATGDLTEGAYAAISAWGDSADTMTRMNIVAKAAQAGYATTEQTLNLLASVTEIYGDKTAKATEHLADMAFVTNKLAIKAPFAEMAANMGKVAPLAKQLGVSQEQLFSTMTAGAGVTGSVAEVSTQMASLYTSVIKESEGMSKVVKATNKELGTGYKSAADMLGSLGTMEFLKRLKASSKSTKEFQKILGGRKEGLVLALALLGGRADKYNEAMAEMSTKTGQMAIAHKEFAEGINKQGHEWEKTKQRMIVFSQRLGDKLLPVLGRLLDKLEPVLQYIEKMDEETMDSWIAFGKWMVILAASTKALSGFLGVVEGLGTLRALTTGLSGVSGELAGVTGKANAAKGAMLGFKVVGVASALAVGVAIGNMLNDIFFAPAAKRREKERAGLEEAGFQARATVTKTGTLEEQKRALANLRQRREEFKKGAGAAGPEDIAGAFTAMVSGTESPGERRGRAYEEFRKGEAALEESISGLEFEQWMGEGQGMYQVSQPRSEQPGQSIQTTNNITINAPGANAEEVVKIVERKIKKSDRQKGYWMRGAARGTAPAGQ